MTANIVVVCGYCREHDKDASLEINFKDGIIYYICPKCKRESKLQIKTLSPPLPKTNFMK